MSEVADRELGLLLQVAGLTDVGRAREHNEDRLGNLASNYAAFHDSLGLLFAVADGMGGHELGEVASQLAIDTLFDAYYHGQPDPALALHDAFDAANSTVFYQGGIRNVSMGTTLAAAVLHYDMLIVANVGDSRVYRLRDGRAQQLTQDHSLVAEQVRRGLLTSEQAAQSRLNNVITRCIGYRESVDIDMTESPLREGDVILICSDGLHGQVESSDLLVAATSDDLDRAVTSLIDLANERGGPDNITVLAIRVQAVPEPVPMPGDHEADTTDAAEDETGSADEASEDAAAPTDDERVPTTDASPVGPPDDEPTP